jgi:hypothetical protein
MGEGPIFQVVRPVRGAPHSRWVRYASVIAGVVGFVALILRWDVKPTVMRAFGGAPGVPLRESIGVLRLKQQAGSSTPTGRGIPAGHVEGQWGDYLPNANDPTFRGVSFVPRSGPSVGNVHTTCTAKVIYGRNGLAPGIDEVYCYAANHWLGAGGLRTGSSQPPKADGRRLFSHSWIGESDGSAIDALRRVDYLVDREDVLIVAGVDNGAHSRVPALLASAYNAIAVGVADGTSSGGYTRVEGMGRCKPEIVAPTSTTSGATPVVAAMVARLLEAADRRGDASRAPRAEVIKAVLLAGALKPKGWAPEPGKPLDEHLGAGIVRVDRSYKVLMAGPSEPDVIASMRGWAFDSLKPGDRRTYDLEFATAVDDLSLVLVWHRRIDGRRATHLLTGHPIWLNTPRLANLDLRLVRVDADASDHGVTDGALTPELPMESSSAIDNVEHVFAQRLPAGRWRIEVTRRDDGLDEAWDYAVAWFAVGAGEGRR